MSILPCRFINIILLCFVVAVEVSCSKDSDLLADHILLDGSEGHNVKLLVDDQFVISHSNSVVLDVLENDKFTEIEQIEIVETSTPENGTVVINEDNTVTYTPNDSTATGSTVPDSFTYTTTSTNTETTQQSNGQATVTVELSQNRTPISGDNVYFVTTSGKSTNNGSSESTAWSLKQAFLAARAGDIVYVKGGNYGSLNLSVSNSGTVDKPIMFIGYYSTPGDINAVNGSTYKYGNSLNPMAMPLISGNTVSGIGQGTGMFINRNYIKIKNFQLTRYTTGLNSTGIYNEFDNIVASEMGDFNPSHSYPTGTSNAFLNYSGSGIIINGNYSQLTNSLVLNCGAQGITVSGGKYQYHNYNKIYSDSQLNPCDYYYLFANGASFNKVENAMIERIGDLTHNGHGLVLKVEAMDNNFINCEIRNTSLECSFTGVKNNSFDKCIVVGGSDFDGGILIANGANNNTFRECVLDRTKGIGFGDWKDGLQDSRDAADAGNNNKFISCIVKNSKAGINFNSWDRLNTYAHDNIFENCHFLNLETLFQVDRPNRDNKIINSTIEKVKKLSSSAYGTQYSLNVSIDSQTKYIDNNF